MACCLITLGLALVGGAMTGFIIKMPCFLPPGDKRPWYEYGNSVKVPPAPPRRAPSCATHGLLPSTDLPAWLSQPAAIQGLQYTP